MLITLAWKPRQTEVTDVSGHQISMIVCERLEPGRQVGCHECHTIPGHSWRGLGDNENGTRCACPGDRDRDRGKVYVKAADTVNTWRSESPQQPLGEHEASGESGK